MISVCTAVEDRLSAAVLERLVGEAEGRLRIDISIPPTGSGDLIKKLPELIRLAPNVPVLLLTDLDRKECAPTLIGEWLGRQAKPEGLLFRVAVREVEAWLLADKQSFASFTRVPIAKLPEAPEDLADPKQTLLNLVTRYSPASLKKDLVADHGHGPRQGLAYNERLSQFVHGCWDLEEASMRADSLARARRRIGELAGQSGGGRVIGLEYLISEPAPNKPGEKRAGVSMLLMNFIASFPHSGASSPHTRTVAPYTVIPAPYTTAVAPYTPGAGSPSAQGQSA